MTKELFALVVEDEKPLATIFTEALKMAGFRTEAIYNGLVAMERLAEAIPDVVVLDINLPGIPGDKIFRYIQSEPRLINTRVLVVTANVVAADELEADADLVLVKPVSFIQLRDLAERLGRSARQAT